MFKITDALAKPAAGDEIPTDVAFYFTGQQPPKPAASLGDVEIRLKRRRQDQSDEQNCRMALAAVLKQLRDRRWPSAAMRSAALSATSSTIFPAARSGINACWRNGWDRLVERSHLEDLSPS